jgi:hypothetical protein
MNVLLKAHVLQNFGPDGNRDLSSPTLRRIAQGIDLFSTRYFPFLEHLKTDI